MQADVASPSPELMRYVKALDDRVSNYARFFNALLVKSPDHNLFFQDLRAFREQEHIIVLLTAPDVDSANLKDIYKECTRHFLASRFAHPWCRNEYGKTKDGFLQTAKGKQRRVQAKLKEEEGLHKLLVPIWIPFRRRMIPTEGEMKLFLEHEKLEQARMVEESWRKREEDEALKRLADEVDMESADKENTDKEKLDKEQHDTKPVFRLKSPIRKSSGSTYFDAEAFVAEDDSMVGTQQRSDGSAEAASLFVGMAASSLLASNKRVRKYLLKRAKK